MNRINKQLVFWRYVAGLTLLLAGCGGSGNDGVAPEPSPDPAAYQYEQPTELGDGWSVADAGAVGVDVETLERMMNAIAGGGFDYIDSIAFAYAGRLVFEETIRTTTDFEDMRVGNVDPAMHRQFSVSKSLTSLLVGVAIDDGFISGIDVPFLDLFYYTTFANPDPRKNDITLHHVLAMQAGLAWDEFDPPYTSPDNQLNRFIEQEFDYAKSFLDLPVAADPGTVFAYSTPASVALGQAIDNAVPMTLRDYGINSLFLPMGITELEVLETPTGLPNGGSGVYLKTRDAAKFAQLLIDGGVFNGERVVSEAWIDASVTPRTEIGWGNPETWAWQLTGYGYQWWTGTYWHGGRDVESWVAWGFGGQWVIAIPELGLAIAINSSGYDGEDEALNQGHRLVRDYILPSIAD